LLHKQNNFFILKMLFNGNFSRIFAIALKWRALTEKV